jgi:hypothetical protein
MPKIYVDENGILRTNNNGILYRPFEYIYEDSNGYLRFRESDDLVHREVAYKYIYKKNYYLYPFRSYIVHHKDRNKRNNRVDNLEILTHEEHNKIHSKSGSVLIYTA